MQKHLQYVQTTVSQYIWVQVIALHGSPCTVACTGCSLRYSQLCSRSTELSEVSSQLGCTVYYYTCTAPSASWRRPMRRARWLDRTSLRSWCMDSVEPRRFLYCCLLKIYSHCESNAHPKECAVEAQQLICSCAILHRLPSQRPTCDDVG